MSETVEAREGSHRLIKTSPGPGSGVSRVSILVEILPGSSYTQALCCLGISDISQGKAYQM